MATARETGRAAPARPLPPERALRVSSRCSVSGRPGGRGGGADAKRGPRGPRSYPGQHWAGWERVPRRHHAEGKSSEWTVTCSSPPPPPRQQHMDVLNPVLQAQVSVVQTELRPLRTERRLMRWGARHARPAAPKPPGRPTLRQPKAQAQPEAAFPTGARGACTPSRAPGQPTAPGQREPGSATCSSNHTHGPGSSSSSGCPGGSCGAWSRVTVQRAPALHPEASNMASWQTCCQDTQAPAPATGRIPAPAGTCLWDGGSPDTPSG